MKAAELRKSILQAAVEGKLVPQDSNDEPVSELLKRIKQEKERLICDGKIKKEKPLPSISDDEIPFDLPEGWAWCRFGEVTAKIHYGYTASAKHQGNAKLLRITDIQGNSVDWHNVPFCDVESHRLPDYVLKNGDILIARTGGTIGKTYLVGTLHESAVFASYLIRAVPLWGKYSISFIKYFLESPLYWTQLRGKTMGTGQPNVNGQSLSSLILPLPPLAEQERIVAKLDVLMAICDELEHAEKELDLLESQFAEYLPKSILQAAVQGKLVAQDHDDEPASELLKRIKQEKDELARDGKIKKEKSLLPINEDEAPCNLPESWSWCRIGDIIQLADNNNIHTNYAPDTMINYVDIDAIDNKIFCIRETKKLPVKSLSSRARRELKKGYIAYSLVRPYLDNIALIEDERENYIGSTGLCVFKPILVEPRYIMTVLLSPYIREHYMQLLSGFNSPSVSQGDFLATLFPLPPLVEQQHIVAKMDEIMMLCNQLKMADSLPFSQKTSSIIPFPQKAVASVVSDKDMDIGIAARGNAKGGLVGQAALDADELLGEE